jgi:hypothetical protein
VARAKRELTEGVTFSPDEFAVYQVPVARIESLTEVRFPKILKDSDVYGGDNEAPQPGEYLEIDRVEDVRV